MPTTCPPPIKDDLDNAAYQCPACQRCQSWRPEAAGRVVTCACGAVLAIPFTPGAAKERHAAEGDMAEEAVEILLCPDCGAIMQVDAAQCAQCGYRQTKPKRRVFRRRADDAANLPSACVNEKEFTCRPFHDRKLPIALAATGLIVLIGLLAHRFSPPHNWADALAVAPLITVLAAGTVALIFGGMLMLTPLLDLSLGPVAPLAIKLAAAVFFPPAVGALLFALLGGAASGLVVGWLAGFVLYLSLFRLLFEFDWPDSMLLIALLTLAHTLVLMLIVWPLTHGPLPLSDLWRVYQPIAAQSVLTFLVAGGIVAPHFSRR